MNIIKTIFNDVILLQGDKFLDNRGTFLRLYCRKSIDSLSLNSTFNQISISENDNKGTLRGIHFQTPPHEEIKLVCCIKGQVFDVIVDLRKNSETYGEYFSIVLNSIDNNLIYIPKGFGHGFQTLEDHSSVLYFISTEYVKDAASGIIWNDKMLNIDWPINPPTIISSKDLKLPNFNEHE